MNQLGVLLLLDSPENLQFGIDNSQWIVGKKFKGIQGIPFGTHYVHYSLKEEGYQFKQGFFFIVSPENKYLVKQWNSELQEFLTFKDCAPYIHTLEMHDFDLYLGVYPMDKYEIWKLCVNMINRKVLDKLDPIKNICVEEYNDKDIGNNTPLHTTIYYTDIPKLKNPSKSQGQQLTALNFDKSTIVEELLKSEYQNDYNLFLGEIQYAFVKFLLGEHFESFEQWKQLLILITSCERLIEEQTNMFIDFIPIFYHQLQQMPNDFFVDPISSSNFIQSCIKNMIELSQNDNPTIIRQKLIQRCNKLKELIKIKFVQNAVQMDDEDEPVVVEDFNFIQL
ncbi:unnamed protein product [Paramecium pentaurelia]|uniref:AAR2 protein n=1 Tax=Paramecium pentaurelia TaxID=43138 RepID=A0A8S1YNR5_9CILI|nr:unnamed protein product [Paramecium pentaurelia]